MEEKQRKGQRRLRETNKIDTPEQSLLTKLPQVPQVPECLSAQVPQALWVLFEKKRSVALLEMDSLIVLSSF